MSIREVVFVFAIGLCLAILGFRLIGSPAAPDALPQEGIIRPLPQSAYGHLYRLTLDDGTRCLLTYQQGEPSGISCQWKTD